MLDFTSSLYLGLRHASGSLRPWAQLTAGMPAALAEPPQAQTIAAELARLIGTERATLARSTLHAFWDVFGALGGEEVAIYVDAKSYPIARWGAERAAARGAIMRTFPHRDPAALHRRIHLDPRPRAKLVALTDGVCPACGPAPVRDYLDVLRQVGGTLLLDDTQALGILGHTASSEAPYGDGGGGTLRWHRVDDSAVTLVSSLAKGFGVPMTVLAGSRTQIENFEASSETRVHGSPPSFADLHATERALRLNRKWGDALRRRLGTLVCRFRAGLARLGLIATQWLSPVQSLAAVRDIDAPQLHRRLLALGIRALLHRPACRGEPTVSFVITARHTAASIDRALHAVRRAITTPRRRDGVPPSWVCHSGRWRPSSGLGIDGDPCGS